MSYTRAAAHSPLLPQSYHCLDVATTAYFFKSSHPSPSPCLSHVPARQVHPRIQPGASPSLTLIENGNKCLFFGGVKNVSDVSWSLFSGTVVFCYLRPPRPSIVPLSFPFLEATQTNEFVGVIFHHISFHLQGMEICCRGHARGELT